MIGAAVRGALTGGLGKFLVEKVATEVKVPAKRTVAKSHRSRQSVKPERKRVRAKIAESTARNERPRPIVDGRQSEVPRRGRSSNRGAVQRLRRRKASAGAKRPAKR